MSLSGGTIRKSVKWINYNVGKISIANKNWKCAWEILYAERKNFKNEICLLYSDFVSLMKKFCESFLQQSHFHKCKNLHAWCKNLLKVSHNIEYHVKLIMQARLGWEFKRFWCLYKRTEDEQQDATCRALNTRGAAWCLEIFLFFYKKSSFNIFLYFFEETFSQKA